MGVTALELNLILVPLNPVFGVRIQQHRCLGYITALSNFTRAVHYRGELRTAMSCSLCDVQIKNGSK